MGVELGKTILAFLVLMNPFGALSIFLDLTRNHSRRERRTIAKTAALAVFIAITVFTLTGGWLLKLFGISVGAFQVGGGILVLLIAISLMNSGTNTAKPEISTDSGDETTAKHNKPSQNLTSIAVVPISIPLIVGPGGISTVVIYASAAKGYADILLILLAGLIISLICYITLMAASSVSKLLGETGLTILNRIMGMLLAAVSVEIIVAGLKSLFPALAG